MKRTRRQTRNRFALSEEAAALILGGSGGWEHVQLSDGDAAQKMVPGVKAGDPIYAAIPVEALDERPDPNQLPLPDFE